MHPEGILKLSIILMLLVASCNFRPTDRDLADQQYEFAAECLDAFFIFRDRLPPDIYAFSTPEELYESVHEPYTEYFNREYARMLMAQLSTTHEGGIGIRIDSVSNGYIIKDVFVNSPGESAGLHRLDTIIRVGDTPTTGLAWRSFTDLLQGDIGTDVVLRVKRGGNFMNITVTRGEFASPSVFTDSLDTLVASIILTGFYQETVMDGGTAAEFSAALQKTTWADYTIIDLRDNGGGYIDQCIEIIGELVPGNTPIIKTHERSFDESGERVVEIDSTYHSSGSASAADRKLFILVNGYTASASEIMVSCLMRRQDVTVVGATTFGKGRGQIILGGPDSVIAKVTCMTMVPVGEGAVSYDSVGIVPDVASDSSDAFDVALDLIEAATASAKRRNSPAGRRPGRCDVPLNLRQPLTIVNMRGIGD